MICKLTQRLTLVSSLVVVLLAGSAWAQFEGLDLSDSAVTPKKTEKAPKKKPEAAPAAKALELDLSSTADVKGVLILPPIVKVTSSAGGFSGFDTKKVSEKFDLAAHKRLVASFEKQLEGKVIPVDLTQSVIAKEGLTTAAVRTPGGMAKLAKATHVAYVVLSELNKTGALVGNVYDAEGQQQGQPSFVNNAVLISQKQCDDLAGYVAKELATVAKAAAAAAAAATPMVEAPPPAEEELAEPVTEFVTQSNAPLLSADPSKPRLVVAVGPGVVMRSMQVSGAQAASLAELRTGAVFGLGVYAQISPLQFLTETAGKAWSDFELEVNWRRAFAAAKGLQGSIDGQTCSVTDDDLQLKATYRYKLDGEYLPALGIGGGYSQERTLFACNLPVVSTAYQGVDLQLRVRQPIYKSLVSFDLSVGPRFLFSGPSASGRFSIGGEGWVDMKPYSYLFARAGGRVSRLQAVDGTSLAVVDTRMFFGVEVGAYF